MQLPLDVRDLMKSSATYRAEREKPVRITVFVDVTMPQAAIDAAKAALLPQSGNAVLHVEAVTPGDELTVDPAIDVVVALAGSGRVLEASLRRVRERAVPAVVLALDEDRNELALRLSHPVLDTIVERDAGELIASLGRWLAEHVPGKRVALAANFPFVRRAVAEEAVKATAFQNAVIGGVAIIPGADMPIMTANQAKMVMQIAAAYGQSLGAERIKELATVVGGAFALRTVARQFVGLIPGFGWAIKAGIGYSGTLAMGYAAIEYFEGGGDLRGLADKLKEARDAAVEQVAKRRGRGRSREMVDAYGWVVVTDGETESSKPALPASGGEPEPEAGGQAGL